MISRYFEDELCARADVVCRVPPSVISSIRPTSALPRSFFRLALIARHFRVDELPPE